MPARGSRVENVGHFQVESRQPGMRRHREPTFNDLVNSLSVLCRAEKASNILCYLVDQSVDSWENAYINLSDLIQKTENPVIAMLARMAIAAR
jgi:hypothetical protein